MKILIICSENSGKVAPFIREQAKALEEKNITIDWFTIKKKGVSGYLQHWYPLKKKIKSYNPDIIHAHYGLSGLFANLQRRKPVVTTYHGTDINNRYAKILSKVSIYLSKHNIFVSNRQTTLVNTGKRFSIIPCGIDLSVFKPIDMRMARTKLGLSQKGKYVLFSSSFDNQIKNYTLAKQVLSILNKEVELLELKGYDRAEVNLLMNACDVALLTSKSEGSPQFVKEAMACNLPVVTVDVGDVKEIIGDTSGCYICDFDEQDLVNKIKICLHRKKKTNGRDRITNLDNLLIARQLLTIYSSL